jgi:CBS domain-containing protein
MTYFLYYQAKDVMTPDPITVGPDATLAEVETIFEAHYFNGLPVVDSSTRLLGVITKLDLLKANGFMEENRVPPYYPAVMRQSVSEVMTKEPDFVDPETPLREVLKRMIETRNKSLPVVESGGVIGVVAREDVLIALRKSALGVVPARLISPDLEGLLEPAPV